LIAFLGCGISACRAAPNNNIENVIDVPRAIQTTINNLLQYTPIANYNNNSAMINRFYPNVESTFMSPAYACQQTYTASK
jgi:hypothetical protein